MQKSIVTTLLFTTVAHLCTAQDTIVHKSGQSVQAKIIEITPTEVKYKRFDNPEGPLFIDAKSDITMIQYENGTKETSGIETKFAEKSVPENSSEELYRLGQIDAARYYDGYKASGTGTLVLGLLSPLAGLIPAIACSSTPPKDANLNYPNSTMINKSDYYDGYTRKAKKIKQGKVWTNWGIALGVNIVAIILLSSGAR